MRAAEFWPARGAMTGDEATNSEPQGDTAGAGSLVSRGSFMALGAAASFGLITVLARFSYFQHKGVQTLVAFGGAALTVIAMSQVDTLFEEPFVLEDGYESIPDRPGLGPVVDPSGLEVLRLE